MSLATRKRRCISVVFVRCIKSCLPCFTNFENWTLFSAADCKSSMENIFMPLSLICFLVSQKNHFDPERLFMLLTNFAAFSIFVPCSLATMGVFIFILSTTLTKPWAIASHLTIPPKMLTKIAVTLGSLVIRSNACLIAWGVAPPPTSRKLAGEPPLSLIMSIVAIARPAPFTRHPMSPSSLMKFSPDLDALATGNWLNCKGSVTQLLSLPQHPLATGLSS